MHQHWEQPDLTYMIDHEQETTQWQGRLCWRVEADIVVTDPYERERVTQMFTMRLSQIPLVFD